jgi:hypothetical protein
MEIRNSLPTSRNQPTRPEAGRPPNNQPAGPISPVDTVELSGTAPTATAGPSHGRLADIDRRLAAGGITGRERILLTGERNRLMAESNRQLNPEFEPGPALGFCEQSERSLRVIESATGRVGPVQNLHGLVEAGCTPDLSTGQRLRQAATEAAVFGATTAARGRGMAMGAAVGGQVGMTGGAVLGGLAGPVGAVGGAFVGRAAGTVVGGAAGWVLAGQAAGQGTRSLAEQTGVSR